MNAFEDLGILIDKKEEHQRGEKESDECQDVGDVKDL
jgi:hypothetical protein